MISNWVKCNLWRMTYVIPSCVLGVRKHQLGEIIKMSHPCCVCCLNKFVSSETVMTVYDTMCVYVHAKSLQAMFIQVSKSAGLLFSVHIFIILQRTK